MTVPMRRQEGVPVAGTVEDVLIRGNLSELTSEQRTEYYMRVCHSLGLNHLTRPFDYLTLNGKLVLYARRDCADQLRRIRSISVEIVSQDRVGDLLSVHVRAKDKDGRTDEDLGVVFMPQTLKGDAAANAILKAVTKAKRRVTLSISGLGFLDETEVEDIPQSAKATPTEPIAVKPPVNGAPKQIAPLPPAGEPPQPPFDPNTGELSPHKIAYDDSERSWAVTWGQKYIAALTATQLPSDLGEWAEQNKEALKRIEEGAPNLFKRINTAAKKRLDELTQTLEDVGEYRG